EGKAIRLHPLVCTAFNADFDGDQMAVHVPLSYESQLECRFLMLSANNLLSPASGFPVMIPTQDIVLGVYYLTKLATGRKGEGRAFASEDEVMHAMADKQIDMHAKIRVRLNGKTIETTAGRIIFNTAVPEGVDYVNELLNKKRLQKLVETVYKIKGTKTACNFLDDVKALGYEYATRAGITFGAEDLVVPEEKKELIDKSLGEVNRIRKQYDRGIITEGERYNKLIDLWTHTTNMVADMLHEHLARDKNGFNPVYIMMDSQARGSKDQIKQLAGMRGLMQKPQKKITGAVGEIIENPIISNFKDGLTVLEYFISTHGARKGLADTALKTADAGYLTRRLVDVVQDVVVSEEDCGTSKGIEIEALRILGRVTQEDVFDPVTEALICPINTLIDETIAKRIEDAGIESLLIRSVLTCDSVTGVCQKCYGRNLATGKPVNTGEAVGIMAAQSIGEPGTQLTLRTFHIGGTASRLIAQSKEVAKIEGFVKFHNVETVKHENEMVVMNRSGEITIHDESERERFRYNVPYGAFTKVEDGQKVAKGTALFEWDPYNNVILAPKSGKISFHDLVDGETIRESYDERSGITSVVVIEHRERKLHPHIQILDEAGQKTANIAVPTGGLLQVTEEIDVKEGDILIKIPRESSKSRDITGGLPRVAELFEARKPKDVAVVSEIDGFVEFGENERGNKKIIIRDEQNESREYLVPLGKHLRVHEGDRVKAGDRLSEGSIDPHDILRIKGENAVQQYLLDEIQAVYRLQGVTINDKHVEVIVAQMLRKVRVEKAGDTEYLEGDDVDKKRLRESNERVISEGGEPATFKPMLLGITKASLTTESFLSAASFQETTKVLSRAAVEGKVDNLNGLKENLIMGNLIPAGTGSRKYRGLKVKNLENDAPSVAEHDVNEDFVDISGQF
ncbi:MAG: DNA-directed RNA polymerase subunit beta', partial [Fibrobacter sp.]|nr:DNA-directed RNA polymerase subunit beta' [Fibrobacter sp.]